MYNVPEKLFTRQILMAKVNAQTSLLCQGPRHGDITVTVPSIHATFTF